MNESCPTQIHVNDLCHIRIRICKAAHKEKRKYDYVGLFSHIYVSFVYTRPLLTLRT